MAEAAAIVWDALAVTEDTRAIAGSARQTEFAGLLAANWDRAYRFAYHLTGNATDADDLVQQAAEEALRAFDRFQPGTHFDRWLLRILHNSFLDRVRRDRRRKMISLDALPVPLPASRTDDPEALAAIDGPVRGALLNLPVEFRAVVVLVDIEGLSYDDAARILRVPLGTVRSRLHRGRLALREWLRPYVDAMRRGEL